MNGEPANILLAALRALKAKAEVIGDIEIERIARQALDDYQREIAERGYASGRCKTCGVLMLWDDEKWICPIDHSSSYAEPCS